MADDDNHAIVFGAAGLLGWSVVNQLLSGYPRPGAFSKVTAVVHRPIAPADLCLPEPGPDRPELRIVSGIDLLQGSGEALARQLAETVADAGRTTHVFYLVFSSFDEDHARECEINCSMMRRVVDGVNILAPSLRAFVYPGGTRGYGIYVPGGTFTAPLEEALADQLPRDYANTCAYPSFRQILTRASRGRAWSWTEVCPDAVVGFSPNGSAFSLALHWAQYLSLYAFNHGVGGRGRVAFPGCQEAFDSKFTPVSGKTLGRICIHAALNQATFAAKVVNAADQARPTSLASLWPAIAAWFGLVGVGPAAAAAAEGAPSPSEYVDSFKHVFAEQGRPRALVCGVGAGAAQLDSVGWWLSFDRHLSLERLRALGFAEERDPVEGWLDAFEQFRAAGIIL